MRLIDADKLILSLNDNYLANCPTGNETLAAQDYRESVCEGLEIAMKTVEDAPTVSGWVSVKDGLPDEDGSTLICTKNGKVCTARFYKRQGGWNAYAGRNAEYWMPLPKPQKEDDA